MLLHLKKNPKKSGIKAELAYRLVQRGLITRNAHAATIVPGRSLYPLSRLSVSPVAPDWPFPVAMVCIEVLFI